MTASQARHPLVAALAGALLLAALSTLGDFIWANWRVRHLMLYGVLHGMAIFLAIGLVLGGRTGAPLLGAMAGVAAGAGAAGSFYLLAPVMGYSAMFLSWVLVWIALGLINLWLTMRATARRVGAGSSRVAPGALMTEGLGRGVVAALASGAAFYAVSGMWFPFNPAGWDYAVHFASWTVAFLPGFATLLWRRPE
jgi:hypothetical protein